MLTVRTTTGVVGGSTVNQHGVFLGDYLICTYPMTEEAYWYAVKVVRAANIINHRRMEGIKDPKYRESTEVRYLELAKKLNMNKHGLTNHPKSNFKLELQ